MLGVSDARTAWFVISVGPVSFRRFDRFFRDSLGCFNALSSTASRRAFGTRPLGGRTTALR
jgi:uncharacterized protein YigE (DUF2233 family)